MRVKRWWTRKNVPVLFSCKTDCICNNYWKQGKWRSSLVKIELFMYRVWIGKKNFVCYWHGLFNASLEVIKNNFGSPVRYIFTFSNNSLITAVCDWGVASDVVWIMFVFPVIIQKAAWLLRFPAVFVCMDCTNATF